MNILFLSRWFPFPPNNGSKLRIYHLLRGLSKSHSVTLLSFVDEATDHPTMIEPNEFCAKIEIVPWKPFNPKSLKSRMGFFSSLPRSILDTYSPQMEKSIRSLMSSEKHDLVIASQLSMAAYRHCFSKSPAIFEELELGLFFDQTRQNSNKVKRFRYNLTWFKLHRYLSNLLPSFQACTIVSEQEKLLLSKHVLPFNKAEVIPNCVSLGEYEGVEADPNPSHLIFSGSFRYHTNYEAMLWFIREVYPILHAKNPEIFLTITGDHADLTLPPAKNIILSGYVDDIKKLIASSTVSIVPIWSGGGTRLKILEAMAVGTPVVSTSKGAEGLDVEHGKHLIIADSPEDFANGVLQLLQDKGMRSKLSANAKILIKEKYDWEAVLPHFLQLVDSCVV